MSALRRWFRRWVGSHQKVRGIFRWRQARRLSYVAGRATQEIWTAWFRFRHGAAWPQPNRPRRRPRARNRKTENRERGGGGKNARRRTKFCGIWRFILTLARLDSCQKAPDDWRSPGRWRESRRA